ncbi:MAG: hypothetical protein WCI42_03405, partial [Verrucomicrobiota bacterium]
MKSKTDVIGKKEMGKTVLAPAVELMKAVPSPPRGPARRDLTRLARLEPKDLNLISICAYA